MKKILGLAVAAMMVMAMVGAGTWAYFSDTETSAGNVLTAGTLELQVNTLDEVASTLISFADANPGTSGSVSITLDNSGSIAGTTLTVNIANLVDADGTATEPEVVAEGGTWSVGPPYGSRIEQDLSANATVTVFVDDGTGGGGIANDGIQNGSEVSLASGFLSAIAGTGPWTVAGGLAAAGTQYISVTYSIDGPSVGNEIQGDTATFDLSFVLTQ